MSTDKGKLAVMLGPLPRGATFVHSFVGPSEAKRESCLAQGGAKRQRRTIKVRRAALPKRYVKWYICPGKFLPGLLFFLDKM